MNALEKASTEYILILLEDNTKKIEDLTLQNIGFEDELNRRLLK